MRRPRAGTRSWRSATPTSSVSPGTTETHRRAALGRPPEAGEGGESAAYVRDTRFDFSERRRLTAADPSLLWQFTALAQVLDRVRDRRLRRARAPAELVLGPVIVDDEPGRFGSRRLLGRHPRGQRAEPPA